MTEQKCWKDKGNYEFVRRNYEAAIECYTRGIKEDHAGYRFENFLNRSASYLKVKRYYRALSDAETALKMEPIFSKALYRKIKALVGLGRYSDALTFAEGLTTDFECLPELIKKARELAQQQKSGSYNVVGMKKRQARNFGFETGEEIADGFISESIGVKEEVSQGGGDSGRGRGIVALKEIKAGTLLVAVKASVHILTNMTDAQANKDAQEKYSKLVQEAIKSLELEPEKRADFYNLSAGKELGYLEKPEIGAEEVAELDPDRIKGICDVNHFSIFLRDRNIIQRISGVWIFPSYINNDCIDFNCEHEILSDFMFIRANRDIAEGEELLIAYKSFEKRIRHTTFKCSCRLCLAEDAEPECVREELYSELAKAEANKSIVDMKKIIKRRIGRFSYPELTLRLIPWLFKLSSLQYSHMKVDGAIESVLLILEILEKARCITTDLYTAYINLLPMAIQQKNMIRAKMYGRELVKAGKLFYGSMEILDLDDPDGDTKMMLRSLNIPLK